MQRTNKYLDSCSFSSTIISVVFLFDLSIITQELMANEFEVTPLSIQKICIQVCNRTMKEIANAGFTSLLVSCSEWARINVDPISIASNAEQSITSMHIWQCSPD